jgi:hypothetical protein
VVSLYRGHGHQPKAHAVVHQEFGGVDAAVRPPIHCEDGLLYEKRKVERAHRNGHRNDGQNAGPHCTLTVTNHGSDSP